MSRINSFLVVQRMYLLSLIRAVTDLVFFFQAEDGIRDVAVTGVQTCALPILGNSIVKVHVKDFKRKEDGYAWVNLGDGDVDWAAVRQAFADIGYSGSAITELEGGDEAYLRDVVRRFDRFVLGRG